MVIEWKSMLFVLVVLGVMVGVVKLLEKKLNLKAETKRKLIHMSMGFTMLTFPYIFTNTWSVGILGGIALVAMYLLKNTGLKKTLGTVLFDVDRKSLGEVFFILSVFFIFYLSQGDPVTYSIPILILTLADSTAALVGKSYGKNKLNENNEDAKSFEGSFMFFMVAFMCTLVPLLLFTEVGREETLVISTIIGLNVAIIEMISHTGNDNLLIPLTSYAFLATHLTLTTHDLRRNLIILAVMYVIIMIVNKIKVFSKLATVEVLVVGYLTIILYGLYAVVPPALLFLTALTLPHMRPKEKENVYDSRIIETNILIGIAICGIVAITGWKKEFFMTYATCYSMHLILNTYIRLRYYFDFSDFKSVFYAVIKGLICIFLPSMLIQKLVFGEVMDYVLLFMVAMQVAAGIAVYVSRANVKEEEFSVDNGYFNTRIILALTIITGTVVYITNMLGA